MASMTSGHSVPSSASPSLPTGLQDRRQAEKMLWAKALAWLPALAPQRQAVASPLLDEAPPVVSYSFFTKGVILWADPGLLQAFLLMQKGWNASDEPPHISCACSVPAVGKVSCCLFPQWTHHHWHLSGASLAGRTGDPTCSVLRKLLSQLRIFPWYRVWKNETKSSRGTLWAISKQTVLKEWKAAQVLAVDHWLERIS